MSTLSDDIGWGSDTPISLPAPAEKPILVDMEAFGFTEFGLAHNVNRIDLEDFIPTYLPQGGNV